MVEVQGADMAFSPGFRWGTSLLPGDTITMEHLMDQTAITYPTATLNNLTGAQIKEIMEDVADNLYHEDPYYQQGGDMVRVGGMTYTMDLTQKHGKRIQDMEIKGKKLEANKSYKVAGWASVQENPAGSRPIWDVVSEWLLFNKSVKIDKPYLPKLKGADNNPGIA
jgi:sulfur-oxidizing protein SoxB